MNSHFFEIACVPGTRVSRSRETLLPSVIIGHRRQLIGLQRSKTRSKDPKWPIRAIAQRFSLSPPWLWARAQTTLEARYI